MKLVVGLGNPGKEYKNTRHNIGFMFLDFICKDGFSFNKKMNALENVCLLNGEKIIFVKPLSFMNLSGSVVLNYFNYYKLKSTDVFVIQDDLDMSIGKYKIMFNHGDGGHNGIKDIIKSLSSKEFFRLKIGISRNISVDTKEYVLGLLSKKELNILDESFNKLRNVIDDFLNLDKDVFIQKYNTRNDD